MCTCIRFTGTDGGMFFGRNLDWGESYGEHVLIAPRNLARTFAFDAGASGSRAAWPAIIGMGIPSPEGQPLYFDCANEHGLAVAGLNFPGFAAYERCAVDGKVNVAADEFPYWVCSMFASVDEAEEALRNVAIVGKPAEAGGAESLLHWMIADGTRSIAVEYMADGMHIHDDDVDTLTNQPTFDWQRENLRNYIHVGSEFPESRTWGKAVLSPYGAGGDMRGLPGDYYSTSRFVRCAFLNSHYPAKETEHDNVTRLFRTLGGVAMCEGAAMLPNGGYAVTLYTGGYSAATRTYYYSTYDDPAIRSVSITEEAAGGCALIDC